MSDRYEYTTVCALDQIGDRYYIYDCDHHAGGGEYKNVITVSEGAISITASDCPGEDCVHSGAIRTSGRSIVCLPNEVEVRVVNAASDVDFVVG